MGIMYKLGAFAIVAAVLSTAVGLGYNHYQGLLEEVSVLTADNTTLTLAVEIEKTAVQSLQSAVTNWQAAADDYELQIAAVQESEAEARSETRRLNEIFGQHDLTRLALARPGLIESRINDGTERVFNILICETTTPGRCDSDGNPEADEAESPGT